MREVNRAPRLSPPEHQVIDEQTAISFTASALDPDLAPNTLSFGLPGAPAGASIDSPTGVFS